MATLLLAAMHSHPSPTGSHRRLQSDLPCGTVTLSGYSCSNGQGVAFVVNQRYAFEGLTADERYYYRGIDDPSAHLYYSGNCGGTGFNVWGVFSNAPDLAVIENTNQESGACSGATVTFLSSTGVPESTTWFQYCGSGANLLTPPWSTVNYESGAHTVSEVSAMCSPSPPPAPLP